MIGAIAGEIIGSVFKFDSVKSIDFHLFSANSTFTDDTILTIAVADCILNGREYGFDNKRVRTELSIRRLRRDVPAMAGQ